MSAMIPLPLPPGGREQSNRSHPQKPRPPRRPPPSSSNEWREGEGETLREHTRRTPSTAPEQTRPSEGGRDWPRGSAGRPASEEARVEGPEMHREGRSLKGETTAPTKGAPGEKLPIASQTNPYKVTRHGELGGQLKSRNRNQLRSRNRCNWETPPGVDM